MVKLFKVSLVAAFALAAFPIAAPLVGGEAGAQARQYKKHHHKRHYAKRGKYQYQYVPNASGRTGAWR